jgi:L-seryl-tRNA(Ser) seleniumtransferase
MSASARDVQARLRALPAVDRLATEISTGGALTLTRAEAILAARAVLAETREEVLNGCSDEPDLVARARKRLSPSLRRVLNGTGVVIHTNLGRAPLSEAAIAAVNDAAVGYSNLELDLTSGRRGIRDSHLQALLRELTGAEDGIAVNNGAGAVLLAIAAIGGRERGGIAISRAQLVEIGGGFRIPDVLSQAGVPLVEIGTSNRTKRSDYEQAISKTSVDTILRVHQSNFRTVGFVEDVDIESLCTLEVPVIDDIGSGALATNMDALIDEPSVRRSVTAGASLVCFSGDKLLGGPQAGLIVGRADAVAACRRHPLARALRIGRLPLAALAATLALYRDPPRAQREVPALAMLTVSADILATRAARLAEITDGKIVNTIARVGGGALPLLELYGPAVALPDPQDNPLALAAALRAGKPPLVTRVAGGQVLIDPRTLAEDELELAGATVGDVLAERARHRIATNDPCPESTYPVGHEDREPS